MRGSSAPVAAFCLSALVLAACRKPASTGTQPSASASALMPDSSSEPPWSSGAKVPATPEGMVWIPPGALVAGTPAGVLPRIPDQEMAGEQVILKGFFISIYAYPNEEGAIPLSNVTEEEAAGLCQKRGERLCTELEWERACKGPENQIYEYGDHYRPEVCNTGTEPRMLPSGLRVACRSDFGVRDMHGSIWEWTSSPWGRGTKEALVSLRGGNASSGELTGRCANAVGKPPDTRSPTIGFRCCGGPANDAKVVLSVERKTPIERRKVGADDALARRIEAALPAEARAELKRPDTFRVVGSWLWHPVGNEELFVFGGCTSESVLRGCGVVVVRLSLDEPVALAWTSSGRYVPSLSTDYNPRFLWVYGGDDRSHFRTLVTYAWGRVAVGTTERNPKARK